MPEITEIYSVRGEESIRDGALEYSASIMTRTDAESDAALRCAHDRSIRKVVYYRVNDDGSFRTLFSFENPNRGRGLSRRPRRQMPDILPRGKGPRTPANGKKPGLIDRLLGKLKE